MMTEDRITKDSPIADLVNRPTASGHDRRGELCRNIREALELEQMEVASDLMAQLERLYPGEDETRKLRLRFGQAQARPLLNKLCGPDDVARIAVAPRDMDDLPLKVAHRALIEHIDGTLSVGDLFDVVGLSPLEFAEALRDLSLFGVVSFERRTRTSRPPSSRRRRN